MTTHHLADLKYPVIAAPMAGGASTPRLVTAVATGGGLGFLAGGYKTVEELRDEIRAVRGSSGAPFGVNLFAPGTRPADVAVVAAYRNRLAPEAARYGIELPDTPQFDDDGYEEKLALLVRERVPMVSTTFGCPSAQRIAELRAAGIHVLVTVTSSAEARAAVAAGADSLCVQGPAAGGHRGSFSAQSPTAGSVDLLTLLAQIRDAVDVPLVAAGGLMSGRDIAAVLRSGAVAAQLGTAFLRSPESGAHTLHKAALVDPAFSGTSVTRAFSGRPARGLTNRFMTTYGDAAPDAYPEVHHLTRPLRAAAARQQDPEGMALWAGEGHRLARDLPAATIVELLGAELAAARPSDSQA